MVLSLVGCARRDDCSSGFCPHAFVVVRRSHWDCPGFGGGLDRNRLFHKRPVVRPGPLQDRWNRIPASQHGRSAKPAFNHLIRLEQFRARLPHYPRVELCSRMDMEEVFLSY